MIANIKCSIELPEKENFLINPIIDYYTILEKVNFRVVYNPFFRKNFVVQQRFGIYPVYLPEVGCLLALETISPNLSEKFYKETKEFEQFYSDEKIIYSKIYNFDNRVNRFVSWGNYISSKLSKELYRLYLSNLINDFLFMPSIVKRFGLISPNRWFFLESRTSYYFRTEVNYNVGVIYLSRGILKNPKKLQLWLNSPLDVWEVPAGFVIFTKNGDVLYKDKILVHFLKDPLEEIELISNKGEYFTCFLLSLNNYVTNFPKFKPSVRKKVNINLVENLTELIYSPYEIIPFMFPSIVDPVNPSKLIFESEVKKEVLRTIINRLVKFSSVQHPELIDSYRGIFEDQNKLFQIRDDGEALEIKIVNPGIIPFLLKECMLGRKYGRKEMLEGFIHDAEGVMEKLKEIQDEPPTSIKWYPLRGIGRSLKLKMKIFRQYLNIWKQSLS